MSSEWRGRLTGTDGSNPFSSTSDSSKPDHSDRSGAGDEQLGKPGNVGGSEETQMTITRREILHRAYPRLHPACPQAPCRGVTS